MPFYSRVNIFFYKLSFHWRNIILIELKCFILLCRNICWRSLLHSGSAWFDFFSVRLSLRDGESTFAGKVMFDGLKMAILAILALLKVEPCRGNKNSKKLTWYRIICIAPFIHTWCQNLMKSLSIRHCVAAIEIVYDLVRNKKVQCVFNLSSITIQRTMRGDNDRSCFWQHTHIGRIARRVAMLRLLEKIHVIWNNWKVLFTFN